MGGNWGIKGVILQNGHSSHCTVCGGSKLSIISAHISILHDVQETESRVTMMSICIENGLCMDMDELF